MRDVEDHALRIEEPVSGFRELLQNIVTVNLTLETKALSEAANPTNEEVKKISAWAAIFFAPTLIGTIYGMTSVSTSCSSAAAGSDAGLPGRRPPRAPDRSHIACAASRRRRACSGRSNASCSLMCVSKPDL